MLVDKLLKAYKEHGKIIVGLDFDGTVFSLEGDDDVVCAKVRLLILDLQKKDAIILCLYTIADAQSLQYKTHIMTSWGIPVDYINHSPVKIYDHCDKPYFNILLDDKAGLNEALEILTEFNKKL
jgi:hypothetical protein